MKKLWYRFIVISIIALAFAPSVWAADPEQLRVEAWAAYDAKDYDTAFRLCSEAAELGNASAQNLLGIMYRNGRGAAQDDAKAAEWYRKAAEQGYDWAQVNLAWHLRNGVGVDKDDKQAFEWYSKAADQGNAEGQNGVGIMYRNGRGVAQDNAKAAEWYRKAAEGGYDWGQVNLAWMYRNGVGVEKDEKQAFEWYRKAADQGNADAQNSLGVMYRNGRGVTKSDRQAAEWYRKAAEQGHAAGQANLGRLYELGEGVVKDEKQAFELYRKSAEQGHAGGQYDLGMAFTRGIGVARDRVQAAPWLFKAARQGNANALHALRTSVRQGVWKPTAEEREIYDDLFKKSFPAFSSATLDGKPVTEDIFAGKKLTMINFWATWCPPCLIEMPGLGRLGKSMPDGTQLVGILVDAADKGAVSEAERILKGADADFLQIKSNNEIANAELRPSLIPTTIFVDSEGQLVGEYISGEQTEQEYRAAVEARLRLVERREEREALFQ